MLLSATVFGQNSINNYKYIIVPIKFDFAKKSDQYQTSSLTKFLFKKNGFTTFLSNEELPQDLAKSNCLALTVKIKDKSNMFTFKSIIELYDCNNNLVYSSKEGKSKKKEYKKGYHEAIRNAFKSIERLKYKYIPITNEIIVAEKSPTIVKTPKNIEVKKSIKTDVKAVVNKMLYAQSTNTGYQVVDSDPKVVFKLLKTNVKDVYVIQNKNGILYRNGNIWVAEYYKGEEKVIKKYQIKF